MLEKKPQNKTLVYSPDSLVHVTKEMMFDSAHQLLEYEGDCSRLHGHTYKLQVTVKGLPDHIGMVIDFKLLKRYISDLILSELDHYNLNDKLDFNTTAENMVVYFYDLILGTLVGMPDFEERDISLTSVKLWESPSSFAEYHGDKHYKKEVV